MAAHNDILDALRGTIEREDFNGYDPYDALMGWSDFRWLGLKGQAVVVQVHKRNPLNLRPLLGIGKQRNAKAVALLLQAYAALHPDLDLSSTDKNLQNSNNLPTSGGSGPFRTPPFARPLSSSRSRRGPAAVMHELFAWLRDNRSLSGRGWGYPFHWANPEKFLPAGTPSAVVTGFVSRGVHDYYRLTQDSRAVELMQDAAQFVLEDLLCTETEQGICFSYTAVSRDCCYNASLLAAETLARIYSINRDRALRDLVVRAVDFVLAHQHPDGRWNYSIDLASGKEREQIDFHQGFILDSLLACRRYSELDDDRIDQAISRGAAFYLKHQFLPDGRAIWRYPKQWPVEIHNQAQGILTFSKLAHLDPAYPAFARTIADWTIKNMQDPRGFFYYQKHRFYTNRIPYMRWSQAWMMLALAELVTGDW